MRVILIFLLVTRVSADFPCMCCQTPVDVFSGPSTEGVVLGRLCENGIDLECKTLVNVTVNQWTAILYQHKVAYIQDQAGVKQRDCFATPMLGETLTTDLTMHQSATTSSSKRKLTTATTPSTTATSMTLPTTTLRSLTTTIEITSSAASTASAVLTPVDSHATPAPTTPSLKGDVNMCPSNVLSLSHRYGTLLAQHDRSCYELMHNKVTWDHGEALCKQAGGHLANINSAQEQNYIQSFMVAYSPTKAFWIGLHDRQSEGLFEWTAGDPVTYTNWIPGHSDNLVSHDVADCVVVVPYRGGIWDDIPCGSQSIFGDTGETHLAFCEYNIAASGGMLVGR